MPSSFAVIIPWHRHRDTWNILQVSAIQFGVESLQLNPPPELWSNAFGGGRTRCSWSTCNDVFLHRFSLALHCGLPALVLHNVVAVLPLGFGFVLNRLGGASCNACLLYTSKFVQESMKQSGVEFCDVAQMKAFVDNLSKKN